MLRDFDLFVVISQDYKMIHFQRASIFLPAVVLQTYSPTECISSSTCRVESPTSLF